MQAPLILKKPKKMALKVYHLADAKAGASAQENFLSHVHPRVVQSGKTNGTLTQFNPIYTTVLRFIFLFMIRSNSN